MSPGLEVRILAAALALTMSACSGGGTIPDDFVDDDPDDPGDSLDDDTNAGVDAKTFALIEVVSTMMVNPSPIANDEAATVTSTYKLVDWERDGVAIQWTETLCGIEATEIFGTLTSFPSALVDTFPVLEREGTLSEAVVGADFDAGPSVTVMGATLDDPSGDALPTSDADSRVFDQDGDSQPGVTVHVSQNLLGQADIYVVQREINTHDGVVISAERIEGRLANVGEQVILGASSWWADAETQTWPDPDPDHSWFAFQQVDDTMDCAGIMAERDTLF